MKIFWLDIRITLLGALLSNFWRFYVIFSGCFQFLAAFFEIKGPLVFLVILRDSLTLKIMCIIDTRIALLGASLTKFLWFYVIFGGDFEYFCGYVELLAAILENNGTLLL